METAYEASRRPVEFATDESGGAGQFVRDGLDAGAQFITVGISPATIISQRLHPRNADGELGQAFAPRTAETR